MKQGLVFLTVTHTCGTWGVDSTAKSRTINRWPYEDKVCDEKEG